MRTRSLVAVTGALALGLSACGGSDGGSSSSASGSSSGASSAAGQKVTIEYLHRLPDGEGMTKVADIVAKWNAAHPDIQVTATKFDGKAAEMTKKIENDVKAGSAPCLAQAGYAELPSLFTKGLLEDVSSEAGKYSDHFSAGSMSLMKVGNATVGLPQDTGPLVYFYNDAELKKLGITPPTTMTELQAAAKKAAAKGKYLVDFQTDEAQYGLAALAAAAGAQWYSTADDKWKVDVTSPQTAKVTAFWQDLLTSKAALTEERWGDGFKKALVGGKLVGTIGAAWEAPLLAGDMAGSAGAGHWRVAPLPTFEGKASTGPDGGSGIVVLKGCKASAQAMQFTDWFNTQVEDLATQGLVVAASKAPATPAALKTFYGGQDVMAELAKANATMNTSVAYIPTWPAVADPMAKAAAAAAAGSGTVASIFTAAQDASTTSLRDAGLPVG